MIYKVKIVLKQKNYIVFRANRHVHAKMQQTCSKNKLTVGERKSNKFAFQWIFLLKL